MSSAAGGEVVAMVVVGAVAGTAIVAAGLAVGVTKCAIGVGRGAIAAAKAADAAWEGHEAARELQARASRVEELRFAEYSRIRAAYESVCAETDDTPETSWTSLRSDSEVAEMQDAMVAMLVRTAELAAEASSAQARLTAAALDSAETHRATSRGRRAGAGLATAAQSLLEQARERMRSTHKAQQEAASLAHERMTEAADAARRDEIRSRILQAAAAVPAGIDEGTESEIAELVSQVYDADVNRLEQLEQQIDDAVRSSTAWVEARNRQSAGAVISALAGAETPTAAELTRRAEEYLAGRAEWDPELLNKARAEIEAVQDQLEVLWKAEVLAQSLHDLGYEVGPGFVSAVVSEDGTFAHRSEWDEHAAYVRINPTTDWVDFRLVREGQPTLDITDAELDEDFSVEQEFCSDVDELEQELDRRGARIDLTFRVDQGSTPLERIPDTGRTTEQARRAGAAAPREMQKRFEDG